MLFLTVGFCKASVDPSSLSPAYNATDSKSLPIASVKFEALFATFFSASGIRSSDFPEGSPTRPVAPPI